MEIMIDKEYRNWLVTLKSTIRQSQIKAAVAVNSELIMLYWELGKQIVDKQENAKWGTGFIGQLSKDLKEEFPDMGGFSKHNLYHIKNLHLLYNQCDTKVEQVALLFEKPIVEQVALQLDNEFQEQLVPKIEDSNRQQTVANLNKINEEKTKQVVSQIQTQLFNIPWGHHILILQKIKNTSEAIFHIQKTIENNWSRAILGMQIETNLYARQGKAITNFESALPKPQSDLAREILKDPYNFSFLTLEQNVQELELEKQLVKNITQFLLELGKGFAYMGRQFELNVGSKNFRLDLLFYHTKLKCYVIIELKTKEFEPEFVGKLNFYLSAIDELVKDENDKPTIGILLCKSKDNLIVEFALKDMNKPIGVSEFLFNELPLNIQKEMPTVEELENELFKNDDNL
jgi:predicted nuclease of restriction endonuclease-like (RecB) superfamily